MNVYIVFEGTDLGAGTTGGDVMAVYPTRELAEQHIAQHYRTWGHFFNDSDEWRRVESSGTFVRINEYQVRDKVRQWLAGESDADQPQQKAANPS